MPKKPSERTLMENQHAKLSKTLENIQKIFSVAEIIAVELVAKHSLLPTEDTCHSESIC